MEWLDVLKIHKGLEFFFDVSVPVAIDKNVCFGHVLFVCADSSVRRHFAEEFFGLVQPLAMKSPCQSVVDSFPAEDDSPEIRLHTVNLDGSASSGEIGAALTNLAPRDVLLLDRDSIEFSAECMKMFPPAMDTFALDIVIGKGTAAKSIRLDLPEFTFVVCVAEETDAIKKLEPHFSYVIKVNKKDTGELCEKVAIMKAQEEGYSLSDDACEYLAKCADCDCMAAENHTARVIEYMRHFYPVGTQITAEHAEDILHKLGVQPKEDPESNADDDDVRTLLRDIRRRLDTLHSDVQKIKSALDDIKGEESCSSLCEIGNALERIEESLY